MVASAARAKAAPKDSRMKRAADSDHDGAPAKKLKAGEGAATSSPQALPHTRPKMPEEPAKASAAAHMSC